MTRSTTPAWRNLRLGIFFLLGLGVLMTALFIVGTNQHLFRRKYDLALYLSNAQGLSRGAMVAVSGLEVGRVSDIRFTQQDTAQAIEVILAVERRYRRHITASSVATMRTVGVLGDKFIDISLGGPAEDPLPSGSVLPVRAQIDWAATLEQGVAAMDDVIRLVGRLDLAVQRINDGEGTLGLMTRDPALAGRLREAVDDLAAVTGMLRSGNGTLGALLADRETKDRFDGLLRRLDRLSAQATEGDGLVAHLLADSLLAARIDSLVADSGRLVNAVGAEGTTGRLISDDTLYRDLRSTLEELRTLIDDIRQNPGRYVRVSIF